MPAQPEIAVVVSTFERPDHLRRCLVSLAAQRGVQGQFEVVVVDDGSRDHTLLVVENFQREAPFPLDFTTHPFDGFQQARCRNEGALASKAPYLLFIDADCILPPDHLAQHLAARRPRVCRAGDCFRLDQATSDRIGDDDIRSGSYLSQIAPRVRAWRRRAYAKALWYQTMRYRFRPKLVGWNMAMWRSDFQRVNGFDQRFRSWGCEDDDLAARLRATGVRILTGLGYTHGFHVWHPLHATTPTRWREGANVPYLRRPVRLNRCLDGLQTRRFNEIALRCISGSRHAELAAAVDRQFAQAPKPLEVELLFWPAPVGFSQLAEHRILVAENPAAAPSGVKQRAHATVVLDSGATADDVAAQLRTLLDSRPVAATAVATPSAAA